MKLASFYAAPVCSVSRAQLLTGCYGVRLDVPGVYGPGRPEGLNDPDHKKTLLVGLRGITSYGSIQKGKADSEAASTSLDTSDKSVFFPAFIPAAPTPQP